MTRLQTVPQQKSSLILSRGNSYFFSKAKRPAMWPSQSPIQQTAGPFCLRKKWSGHDANHSPPSSAEINKVEPHFHSRILRCHGKCRDNFTFSKWKHYSFPYHTSCNVVHGPLYVHTRPVLQYVADAGSTVDKPHVTFTASKGCTETTKRMHN